MDQYVARKCAPPEYIREVRDIVLSRKTFPLKELFMLIRKDHPEVLSMRTLKNDIETYLLDFSINSNNLVISKTSIMNDLFKILAKK